MILTDELARSQNFTAKCLRSACPRTRRANSVYEADYWHSDFVPAIFQLADRVWRQGAGQFHLHPDLCAIWLIVSQMEQITIFAAGICQDFRIHLSCSSFLWY